MRELCASMTAKRDYNKTGLNTLKNRVKARGMRAIDGRSRAAIEVKEFTAGLIADLGGEDQLSTQQLALVDLAARAYLFLGQVDSWLADYLNQGKSLVNKRNRQLLPAVRERQAIAEHLAKVL